MKRYTFRLESLLAFREYNQKQAEAVLAQKSALCTSIGLEIENTIAAYSEAVKDRFRQGGDAADYRATELYCMRLENKKNTLSVALAAADEDREKARLVWVEANKEKELVAKLRERGKEAWKKNHAREEVYSLDETASRMALTGEQ